VLLLLCYFMRAGSSFFCTKMKILFFSLCISVCLSSLLLSSIVALVIVTLVVVKTLHPLDVTLTTQTFFRLYRPFFYSLECLCRARIHRQIANGNLCYFRLKLESPCIDLRIRFPIEQSKNNNVIAVRLQRHNQQSASLSQQQQQQLRTKRKEKEPA